MGFIVKQQIEDFIGNIHDEFYVRIEGYQIYKSLGCLGVTVAHYKNQEDAKSSIPDYLEDVPSGKCGTITSIFSYNGETKEWPMWYEFPLTETVSVTETREIKNTVIETVEYIDFDEDGNEIIKTRDESRDVITYEDVTVPKTLKNINLIGDNLYDYAYSKIKLKYGEIFGMTNIIDMI